VRTNSFGTDILASINPSQTRTRSLVLQLVALLNAEQVGKVAIGSILMSTASTALTATTMFWDFDTDPGSRKRNPDW
jgi:hypothetical protein